MMSDLLVAATVHDVKNRIAALVGRLELAANGAPEATREAIEQARTSALGAAAELSRLLTLMREAGGTLAARPASVDLRDFMEDMQLEAAPFRPAQLVLRSELAPALPAWRDFDAYLVRQALLNALQNAFRHARRDVRLSLATDEQGWLVAEVRDDGPGFALDVLERLAAGAALPAHARGSGLGLALGAAVAGAHRRGARQGRLVLDNPPGGGARFRLLLP